VNKSYFVEKCIMMLVISYVTSEGCGHKPYYTNSGLVI
jgi:hypothetical protein